MTDGRNAHALVEGLTLITGGNAGLREPSWSHDSKRLAYPDRLVKGLTSVDRISVVSLAGGDPARTCPTRRRAHVVTDG